MKPLKSYINESSKPDVSDFVYAVSQMNPGVPEDVKRYFSLMCFEYNIFMHPDDSWEDCTIQFTHKQCEILDDFIGRALEVHGDKVYDWGTEVYMKKFGYR